MVDLTNILCSFFGINGTTDTNVGHSKSFIETLVDHFATYIGAGNIATIISNVSSIISTLSSHTTDLGNLLTNIDGVISTLSSHGSSLSTLLTNLGNLITDSTGISTTITDVGTLTTNLNGIATAITDIGTITTNLTGISTVISNLSGIATAISNISTITTNLTGIGTAITTLSTIIGIINNNNHQIEPVFTGFLPDIVASLEAWLSTQTWYEKIINVNNWLFGDDYGLFVNFPGFAKKLWGLIKPLLDEAMNNTNMVAEFLYSHGEQWFLQVQGFVAKILQMVGEWKM